MCVGLGEVLFVSVWCVPEVFSSEFLSSDRLCRLVANGPPPNRHAGLRSDSQSTMQATNTSNSCMGVYSRQWRMQNSELQILIKLGSYPHRFCTPSQLFCRCCISSPNVRLQGSPLRAADRVAEPWWELLCGWANEVAAMGAEALTRTNAQRAVADIGRIGGRGLARRLYRFLGSRGAADAPMAPRQSCRARRVKMQLSTRQLQDWRC